MSDLCPMRGGIRPHLPGHHMECLYCGQVIQPDEPHGYRLTKKEKRLGGIAMLVVVVALIVAVTLVLQ